MVTLNPRVTLLLLAFAFMIFPCSSVFGVNSPTSNFDLGILIAILVINLLIFVVLIIFLTIKYSADIRKYFVSKVKFKSEIKFRFFCENLSSVLVKLSENKIGAIIACECNDSLDYYINTGYNVRALFSPEFVLSVFYNKHSALHDGGVIVRNYDIFSISSYFPMTRQLLDVSFGARHRAALGLSEKTDAVVFVVSETNGKISVMQHGVIKSLSNNRDRLHSEIKKILSISQNIN